MHPNGDREHRDRLRGLGVNPGTLLGISLAGAVIGLVGIGVVVAMLKSGRPADVGDKPPAVAADPPETVEKALNNYCVVNNLDRSVLEPFALDLIPGTRTFRYVLPPLDAPASSPYAGLPARYAFLVTDAGSGKLIEVKAAEYNHSIQESAGELFAAMRAAGVKVETDADATRVMRTLMYLERAAHETTAGPADVNPVASQGRRFRDDEFEGGVFAWTGGDRIGLRVDADGFATGLSGGHLK